MVASAFGVASFWLLGQQMLRRQLCLRLEADASVLRSLASLRQILMASDPRSLETDADGLQPSNCASLASEAFFAHREVSL